MGDTYVTAVMANCTHEARLKWDSEVSKHYDLLMEILNEDEKLILKESQIAWEKFRDAEFKNIESIYPQNATLYITIRAADKKAIVKERAQQLKMYYKVAVDYKLK